MTPRELVVKTLNHEPVPRAARDLWLPGGESSLPADELAEMNVRYPSDIVSFQVAPDDAKKSRGKAGKGDEYTDAWGCVWQRDPSGAEPQLKASPLAEAERIASYQPPAEPFERSQRDKANQACHATNRFVLACSEVRPFDRLRFLCGGEAALVDLARGTKHTRDLLAMIHDLACKEIELWADSDVDGVVFRDDWGTPEGLVIAPEMWREIFRPLYRDYCKILHAKDKFVFFRSEGNIFDLFGDLIKVGIDAIHSQTHLMDIGRLAKRFRGRVTFWGEIDRRLLREPGSPEEFRKAVLAVRRAFDFGSGGVIAQCPWEPGVRLQTIAMFFEQWLVPMPMHA